MVRFLIACSLLGLIGPQVKTPEDGPSSKVPELKPLDHYVGVWDVQFTSRDLPFAKGRMTTKWVLDGRFVEQAGDLIDKDGNVALKLKTLFGFDKDKNAYRNWIFISDGSVSDADGTWDEKEKVMTFISRKKEGEGFTTTTADFSEAGVESWKIVITDAAGKATAEIAGKNTKAKK